MKNLREIRSIFPQYRIFKSITHPKRYYAVLNIEAVNMEIVKRKFSDIDQIIPESLTVKALPLITEGTDFHYEFEDYPTFHRISDLIEEELIPEE
jgi:hypothetical protein